MRMFLLNLLLVSTMANIATADTFQWISDTNGNWDDPGNWSKTVGSSARTYPNDTTDIADLTNIITADRLISLPAAGIDIDQLQVNDLTHKYILGGVGALSLGGGSSTVAVATNATIQFDTPVSFGTNATNNGGGLFIFNAPASNTSFIRFQSGALLRVNSEFQGNHNFRYETLGTIEIGPVTSITASNNQVNLQGGTLKAVGASRTIDDNIHFNAANLGSYTIFDGTNGNNLTITGDTQITGRPGRDFEQFIDTGTLELTGNVTWTMTDDRAADLGNRPDAVSLVNNGKLIISGSGKTYTDSTGAGVNIQGTGSFIVNNETGSATGSGNTLWIGPNVLLGGDGSVSGSELIVRGGTVSPGNSIGTLTVGTTTLEAGSTLEMELSGSGNDMLIVEGDLDLSAVESLNLIGPNVSDQFFSLIQVSGTINGVFDTIDFGTTGFTLADISYGTILPGVITLGSMTQPIPEPSTLPLAMLGLCGFFFRRKSTQLAG